MNAADPRCAMLSEMTGSAHRLGMAFGAEAERTVELSRKIEYAKLFDRCFFAVRVGIALELRLRREARWDAARADREDVSDVFNCAEQEPGERPERAEHERPAQYFERDRDREVERATLPLLLDTLDDVAADAQALPGPPPAELLTLRDLLARYAAEPARAPSPAAGQALRARLTGSAATLATRPAAGQTLALSPPGPARGDTQHRGATGPPRA